MFVCYIYRTHGLQTVSQQTQNICITFVQRWPNVFDVGPKLYKQINVIQMFCVYCDGVAVILSELGFSGCLLVCLCVPAQYF